MGTEFLNVTEMNLRPERVNYHLVWVLGGFLVTIAWYVLKLWMEKAPDLGSIHL
jgi:hypothetical protein